MIYLQKVTFSYISSSQLKIEVRFVFLAHLINFNQDVLLLSKVRNIMRADARADARELSLVKRGHMARERMREQMRGSGCKSGYYFSTSDWLREVT